MTILTDKTHYIVHCNYGDGAEIKVTQFMIEVREIIYDSSEEDIFQVVEFNVVEGYSRDITEDVLTKVREEKEYNNRAFAEQKFS